MPAIVYNTSGTDDVTLGSSNSAGTSTFSRTAYIRVIGAPSMTIPFGESFEIPGSFPGQMDMFTIRIMELPGRLSPQLGAPALLRYV
ncbi:MAG: hypothetical protein IPL69_20530 [Saprospiraceae bacterium]|nr:hypothetical protein [Candidatus Brachybacter algidus]